jgi:hypothetical protein
MSPKPTVAKTVILKYRASVRVRGWVKFAVVTSRPRTTAQMMSCLRFAGGSSCCG